MTAVGTIEVNIPSSTTHLVTVIPASTFAKAHSISHAADISAVGPLPMLPSTSIFFFQNSDQNFPDTETDQRRFDTLLDSSTLIADLFKTQWQFNDKMSTKSKLKREGEDSSYNNAAAASPIPSKCQQRQHKETTSSKIPAPAAAPMMSAAYVTLSVPDAVLKTYQQMLPENPQGIALLFSAQFSESLQVPAQSVAIQ